MEQEFFEVSYDIARYGFGEVVFVLMFPHFGICLLERAVIQVFPDGMWVAISTQN